jgi:hypothetical protein
LAFPTSSAASAFAADVTIDLTHDSGLRDLVGSVPGRLRIADDSVVPQGRTPAKIEPTAWILS